MNKYKGLALAVSVAGLTLAGGAGARAATVTLTLGPPPASGTYLETFNEFTAAQGSLDGSSGSVNTSNVQTLTLTALQDAALYLNDAQIVQYSLSGYYAAPYDYATGQQETTPYVAVYGGSSSYADFVLTQPTDYFGLDWGSVDLYNSITFFSGTQEIASFTGQDIENASGGTVVLTGGPGPGTNWEVDGTVYANFTSSVPITSILVQSSQNSFEFDNVRIADPVPEPATWAMTLIGFAGAGFMLRRRSRIEREKA